jgi:hypothetical protein
MPWVKRSAKGALARLTRQGTCFHVGNGMTEHLSRVTKFVTLLPDKRRTE